MENDGFKIKFDKNTIDHLGIKLYSSFPPVMAELISNSYDADAENVEIRINYDEKVVTVIDDGNGMNHDELNQNFLVIGRNRRKAEGTGFSRVKNRKVTGKKGLGKLAVFGIAKTIEVYSVKNGLKNAFSINYDDMKAENEVEYKPKVICENENTDDKSGTIIKIREIKQSTIMGIEDLAYNLSRRFSFYDVQFEVKLIDENAKQEQPITKSIYFEKVEGLSSPIDYATLKACPELEKMEYFGNPQGSLFKLTKGEYDFIYDMIRDENPAPPAADSIEKYDKEKFLNDVYMTEAKYDRLVAVLKKKKNIILQGAPGVGKTFAAKRLAYSIMGEKDDDRIEFVQFHQNYSYEDFMMGYKPVEDGFELKYGIFYRFCQKAANHPDKDYFFIIDEINRGNMSKIFGELLMLIEADYRDIKATLAYNGLSFSVPKRLHIIGMMNTADRSLAMIDYALRRRFSFFDMEPGFDSEGFIKYLEGFANDTFNTLIDRIKKLNQEIAKDKSLGKGFCIGHSYFCNTDECTEEWMQDVVDFDVLPMLAEYWFDDTDKLQRWENILHGVFQ